MEYYKDLSSAIKNIIEILVSNDTLDESIRVGLNRALMLFSVGSEEKLVMFIARILYLLEKRIKNKDKEFFKSVDFRRKIVEEMTAFKINEDMMQAIMSAFESIGTIPNSFSYRKQLVLQGEISNIIDLYRPALQELQ